MRLRIPILSIVLALSFPIAAARADWPQWRGPHRDGVSDEKGWMKQWPAAGPNVLWKTNVGNGCSSVAVVGGRLYTMGFALTRGPDGKTIKGDKEGRRVGADTVWCIDTSSGATIWKHSYPSLGDDTYCTPTVYEGTVYTLGRFGQLFCLDAASGRVIWSKDLAKDFGGTAPYYGYACSPLALNDRLIVGCGGEGSQIICLDRKTGQLLWKCGKGEAGFSSPITYDRGGKTAVLVLTPPHVLAISADTGQELWQFPWKGQKQCPDAATTPILFGDKLFVSGSGQDHLAMVLQLPAAAGDSPKVVWKNEEMTNYFQSSILVDGFIYGTHAVTHEEKSTSLRCLSFETGEVKWKAEGFGHASLMAADGKLIIMSDRGVLVIAEATPTAFKEISRSQVLGGHCWVCPVLCDGRIYCRNNGGNLVCLDVKP